MPERAFDLFAHMLLEENVAATRSLNDALKPAFEGQDAVTPNLGALARALAGPWQTVSASTGVKVDAAATEALYAKAPVKSADGVTQECKTLRPIAEMMWTDVCLSATHSAEPAFGLSAPTTAATALSEPLHGPARPAWSMLLPSSTGATA